MVVPFCTEFGTDECICVYAAEPKPRDKQMAVMTPTPARNRFFILAPLCPRWLVWLAEEERASTKSERRAGLLGLSYDGQSHVNEARQCGTSNVARRCGTSMWRVNCAHDCEAVSQGASAWIISSTGQRHFQRLWTPSAGASSKGLEAGKGWHRRTHHKGPVSR